MTEFKVGDKVRFKGCDDTVYTVDDVDDRAGHLVRLKDTAGGWLVSRLEHVQARVEGQKIAFGDIRVGDEIRASRTMEDVIFSRQGTIARIGGYSHPTALYSASGIRLDYNHTEDTYTLIKAAPEKDEVLEKVTEQEDGTVAEAPKGGVKVLCRKTGISWVTFFPSGASIYSNVDFAEWIRPVYNEVRWLG